MVALVGTVSSLRTTPAVTPVMATPGATPGGGTPTGRQPTQGGGAIEANPGRELNPSSFPEQMVRAHAPVSQQ